MYENTVGIKDSYLYYIFNICIFLHEVIKYM